MEENDTANEHIRTSDEPPLQEDSDEDDGEEHPFDISLAATHSYMGEGLVSMRGRCVLEAGWEGRMPVLAHSGAVFPGEIVPMMLMHPHDSALLAQVIRKDRLFGLLSPDETGTLVSGYGVVCEVFETSADVAEGEGAAGTREGGDAPPPGSVAFKARAINRFRFVDMPQQRGHMQMYARIRYIDIRVLPEVSPPDPLHATRLESLNPYRRSRKQLDVRLRQMDAALTAWPLFVYNNFDYPRIREILSEHFSSMKAGNLPEEPVSLSFWVASNLSLGARDRYALLVLDDAAQRLHMELHIIRTLWQQTMLCCSSCLNEISRHEYIFAMSSEGVHSNYINLGGYMHDLVTVTQADNTALSGSPSTEFSWFPGYSWTIALCSLCSTHVGWRFDATRKGLRPQRFFGLCRNYVQPRTLDRNNRPFRLRLPPAPAALPHNNNTP